MINNKNLKKKTEKNIQQRKNSFAKVEPGPYARKVRFLICCSISKRFYLQMKA